MSEVTTRFEAKTRIDKVVDDNSSFRYPAMNNVHCMQSSEPGKVWLSATDGRAAAVNLVDGETDQTVLVPPKVFPTLKSGGTVEKNGRWENVRQGKVQEAIERSRFPVLSDAIPKVDFKDCLAVSLDPDLLIPVLKALQSSSVEESGVTIFVKDCESAVVLHGPHGIGVVMPLTADKPLKRFDDFNTLLSKYQDDFKQHGN